jgi:hypothetical protein
MTEPRDSYGYRELVIGPSPLGFGYVKGPGTSIRGQAFYDQDVASRLPVVMSKKQGEKEFPTEDGRYRTGATTGGAKWSVWFEKYQRGII